MSRFTSHSDPWFWVLPSLTINSGIAEAYKISSPIPCSEAIIRCLTLLPFHFGTVIPPFGPPFHPWKVMDQSLLYSHPSQLSNFPKESLVEHKCHLKFIGKAE